MAKEVLATVKLQVPAGQANPSPPVGPALGQHGVNIMEFCKTFNSQTQGQEGTIIPVVLTIYSDRSFIFVTKSPPAAVLLKQVVGIAKGSKEPNREKVGKVSREQLRQIAQTKMADLNAKDIEAGVRIIEGDGAQHGYRSGGLKGLMAKAGKRYRAAAAKVDQDRRYPLLEAIETACSGPKAKFDETVEIAVRLGVDARHADQMIRGSLVPPHGIGKERRVLVFAKGEKEREARDAGADFVGAEDLVEKIQGGWLDFDTAVATPDLMGVVGRLGKVLGPRGLMPNPKSGTVSFDVVRMVREVKAGKVEFRVDKAGSSTPSGQSEFFHAGFGGKRERSFGGPHPDEASVHQGAIPSDDRHLYDDGPRRQGGPSTGGKRPSLEERESFGD